MTARHPLDANHPRASIQQGEHDSARTRRGAIPPNPSGGRGGATPPNRSGARRGVTTSSLSGGRGGVVTHDSAGAGADAGVRGGAATHHSAGAGAGADGGATTHHFAGRRGADAIRADGADTSHARGAIGTVASERGSGGIAGVAVIGALCALLVAVAPIGGALSARQQLQGAADAAALAAADTASGRVAGSPCEAASSLTSALGVFLDACAVDARGLATIRVSASVLGVGIDATARAGPPGIS